LQPPSDQVWKDSPLMCVALAAGRKPLAQTARVVKTRGINSLIISEPMGAPMSRRQQFIEEINTLTLTFPGNATTRRISGNAFDMSHYRALLLSMFLVAREGPVVSELAAENCPSGLGGIRDALLRSAEDGADHWTWIIDDLQAVGYDGPDPAECIPPAATQAYVGYNHFLASRHPVARLGVIAAVEAIGRNFSSNYSSKVFQRLQLKSAQATFFFRRSREETSLQDILQVLEQADLCDRTWQWVVAGTRTGGSLYRAIYDTQE